MKPYYNYRCCLLYLGSTNRQPGKLETNDEKIVSTYLPKLGSMSDMHTISIPPETRQITWHFPRIWKSGTYRLGMHY